jgi:AcrR family transcriptional regulator
MNDRSNDSSVMEPAAIMLLDAVERIFADRSPSSVSMRAIAAEADCSLGLAYNYFTSKDELIGAALDRMANRIAAEALSPDDPRDVLLALMASMRSNVAFPRLVTWLVLEGHDLSRLMSNFPLERRVAAIAVERGADDPESIAMTMGLLAIGVFTYGGVLNRAVGRDPNDERLLEFVGDVFGGLFPQSTG